MLGATSFIGGRLLAREAAGRVHAFTRGPLPGGGCMAGVTWHALEAGPPAGLVAPRVIALSPLWALPGHFSLLESLGCRRLVALSSTSVFTKR